MAMHNDNELVAPVADFARELEQFLKQEFNRKRIGLSILGKTVCAKAFAFDLYFRLPGSGPHWPASTLVIARIGFASPRKGNGRRLLAFLVEWAANHGFHSLGIECTNQESYAFGQRFGMIDTAVDGDISATIGQLQRALSR